MVIYILFFEFGIFLLAKVQRNVESAKEFNVFVDRVDFRSDSCCILSFALIIFCLCFEYVVSFGIVILVFL